MNCVLPVDETHKRYLLKYLLKFIVIFLGCYYGTVGIIGLAAPSGYYISLVHDYLNYPAWLRSSLFFGAQNMLALLGFTTTVSANYSIRIGTGAGVHLGYGCLGYGVSSFWIAFVLANDTVLLKKLCWLFGGLLVLWCINILRIGLLAIAIHRSGTGDFIFTHHTWFNIAAYACIFTGMYCFDKNINNNPSSPNDATKKSIDSDRMVLPGL